jgi:hypothetical protein
MLAGLQEVAGREFGVEGRVEGTEREGLQLIGELS